MDKMEKMEIFKKNMEEAGFTTDFIGQALQYFTELEDEREVQELETLEEVIDYYKKIGSYTCSTLRTEENLLSLRDDISNILDRADGIMDPFNFFKNIEIFEIEMLYTLYLEFYPREEEEEEENL